MVPEALMLLEEDGLIRARHGVGRCISDTPPHRHPTHPPPEELLAGAGRKLGGEAPPVHRAADAERPAGGTRRRMHDWYVPGEDVLLWVFRREL